MQQEENGCEKVLLPFLETSNGSRLHKNSGIYQQNATGKNFIFLWRKTKRRSIRVPPWRPSLTTTGTRTTVWEPLIYSEIKRAVLKQSEWTLYYEKDNSIHTPDSAHFSITYLTNYRVIVRVTLKPKRKLLSPALPRLHHLNDRSIGSRRTGTDPGGGAIGAIPPETYERNFIRHDFVQYGKQHSRYKAMLSSIVLSQQCCKAYFTSLTVAKPLWDLTAKYYWNPPLTLLAGSAPDIKFLLHNVAFAVIFDCFLRSCIRESVIWCNLACPLFFIKTFKQPTAAGYGFGWPLVIAPTEVSRDDLKDWR